jgi:hypothetical protein
VEGSHLDRFCGRGQGELDHMHDWIGVQSQGHHAFALLGIGPRDRGSGVWEKRQGLGQKVGGQEWGSE